MNSASKFFMIEDRQLSYIVLILLYSFSENLQDKNEIILHLLTKKLDNRNQVKIKKISMIFHGFYCTLKIPEEKALFFRVV